MTLQTWISRIKAIWMLLNLLLSFENKSHFLVDKYLLVKCQILFIKYEFAKVKIFLNVEVKIFLNVALSLVKNMLHCSTIFLEKVVFCWTLLFTFQQFHLYLWSIKSILLLPSTFEMRKDYSLEITVRIHNKDIWLTEAFG